MPYYIADLNRDPNVENYPQGFVQGLGLWGTGSLGFMVRSFWALAHQDLRLIGYKDSEFSALGTGI